MKGTTRSYYLEAVRAAIQRIVARLDAPVEFRALAREAATSPFHFHRIFRGLVGETPLELHRRLRLERAAWQLATGSDTVATIALRAGFETHAAFSRAFLQAFGASPSAYRRGAQDPSRCAPGDTRYLLTSRSGVHYSPQGVPPVFHPNDEDDTMDVAIITLPDQRVAFIAHQGSYHRIGEAFGRLHAMAGPAGLLRSDSRMIGIYHDDPETTPEAELRSEAAVSVGLDDTLPEPLQERTIAGRRFARTVHVGPYRTIGDAWARFMGGWLQSSGERLADDVSFEVYLNGPAEVDESELRTELYIPLE